MNIPRAVMRLIFGRRLPLSSGDLTVSGIEAPVRIRRDTFGVAYIDAAGDVDAWYGLGFCHGQDRAFQLEGLRRVVNGTLAELIGPDGLAIDRLSRRIGFAHSAAEQLDVLDHDVRAMGDAYARGVTEGAKLGSPKPAHEFALLKTAPTGYVAADAIGMLKLMSFLLASNWDSELLRYKILTADGPEAVAALDPTYPEWLPVTDPPGGSSGPAMERLAEDLAVFGEKVGFGGGSNNWAIAGSKTVTGRVIVANDPHLTPSHPSHWYLARVSTPEWTAAGATFVGVPGFPVGMNGHGAWGVTAGLIDNTHLFLEAVDGDSVREGEAYVPCNVRVETIAVKGEDPVTERILEGPRGPIVGPALDGEIGAISMRAVWLDPRPITGLLRVHRARDFGEMREMFSTWPGLPLNIVAGFATGDIGWQLVGEAPQRKKGWGTVPLAGWDPETGWAEDTISVEALPHALNPETGFLATANNRPTTDGIGPYVGVDFIDGYRLARIVEVLGTRDDWDLDAVAELQMDRTPIPWQEMREVVLDAPILNDTVRRAQEMLREWEGVASPDSVAATVYEFFVAEMAHRIVAAKAPNSAEWALGRGFTDLSPESIVFARWTGRLVRLLNERPSGWFAQGWESEIADALEATYRALSQRYGDDESGWAWGVVRPLTFKHPVGERKPMDRVFNLGPFPWGGDANTVSQAAVSFRDPAANSHFVASMRMAVEVGNWDANRFVLPGGQSGNPMSPHYDDQLERYRTGRAITIAWSADAVEAATRETLELRPESPSDP